MRHVHLIKKKKHHIEGGEKIALKEYLEIYLGGKLSMKMETRLIKTWGSSIRTNLGFTTLYAV